MAQDYNFTFQNLNPTTTGWTGGSIQQTLADLRNTPFDPLDKTEVVDDTTAADSTGGGTEILNLEQGQGMYRSVSQVIKNLQKAATKAPDLDTLKYYNEQLLEAQKEQQRIGAAITQFGGTPGKKAGGGGGGGGGGFFSPGHGLFGSDEELTPAQRAERLTKRVAQEDTKLDAEQDKLDAHQTSIDSLQAAIASATDPKVIGNLQKQLAKEREKMAKDKAKFDAQVAHRTELQTRLTALNPSSVPAGTTPAGTTPAPGTPGAPGTPAATAAKAPNYWDELVDKALGTRAGASGWHSGGAAPAVTPAVVPATDLATQAQQGQAQLSFVEGTTPEYRAAETARMNQALGFTTPAVEPIAPVTGAPLVTEGIGLGPVPTNRQTTRLANQFDRRQRRDLRRLTRQAAPAPGNLFSATGSGWTGGPTVGPQLPVV